jgi:hypothetical protein
LSELSISRVPVVPAKAGTHAEAAYTYTQYGFPSSRE